MARQHLILRTPNALSLRRLEAEGGPAKTVEIDSPLSSAGALVWSAKGELCAALGGSAVTIFNGETYSQEARLEIPNLHAVAFSPKMTFLITFQRPVAEAGNADKNLKLWDWREGVIKMQLFQKTFSKDTWPLLQLTAAEDLVLHQSGAVVNAYDPHNAQNGVIRKLSLKGLGGFSVSPHPSAPVIAAFVPEGKGIPGFVGLWKLYELAKGPSSPQPFSRRSFFRATAVRLLWNASGTAVLALTASETDASNKSYYGEQKLHFLAANGTNDCLVALPKEGPVHDIQWSPNGEHFVTVSGYMPAKTSLFSSNCRLVHDLGAGPYNLVRWNPQGRFLAVAGFGNLPGDIGFHEKLEDGTCRPLGASKADDAVTMSWSPDGRHLLTATTAPRMRVNNGFQLFRCSGEAEEENKLEVLLDASWQPADPQAFPDRPASPQRVASAGAPTPSATPIRAGGYVPPHARNGAGTASSGAGQFSLAKEQAPTSRLNTVPKNRYGVPGAESAPAAAVKKPRKRSKGAKQGQEARQPESEQPSAASDLETSTEAATGLAHLDLNADDTATSAKRVRNLKKKLSQIQQIRNKLPTGVKLEPEQQAKLDSEADLVAELEALGSRQ